MPKLHYSGNQIADADGIIGNALQYRGDTRSLIEIAYEGAGNDWLIGKDAGNTLAGNVNGGKDTAVFWLQVVQRECGGEGWFSGDWTADTTDRTASIERFVITDVTVDQWDGVPAADDLFYLTVYKHVLAAGMSLEYHFNTWGAERRQGSQPVL